jgi:hypothetical protein
MLTNRVIQRSPNYRLAFHNYFFFNIWRSVLLVEKSGGPGENESTNENKTTNGLQTLHRKLKIEQHEPI